MGFDPKILFATLEGSSDDSKLAGRVGFGVSQSQRVRIAGASVLEHLAKTVDVKPSSFELFIEFLLEAYIAENAVERSKSADFVAAFETLVKGKKESSKEDGPPTATKAKKRGKKVTKAKRGSLGVDAPVEALV